MLVLHKSFNVQHLAITFFFKGEERKWRLLAEEEAQAETDMVIIAYGILLAPVTSFKYLEIILSASDDN